MVHRHIKIGGKDVSYLDAGSRNRDVVVLIHGSGVDHAAFSWKYVIPELMPHFRVIAPDCPGYGGTAGFDGPYTVERVGRWLIGFLNALHIRRAHIVGLSMGGAVALWVAINHPDRVKQIVPVASYGLQRSLPFHALAYYLSRFPVTRLLNWLTAKSAKFAVLTLRGVFSDLGRADSQIVEELQQAAMKPDLYRSFHQFQLGEIMRDSLTTCLLPDLFRLQHRVVFIHGIHDRLIAIENVEKAASTIRNASIIKLRAGHWPMREAPKLFAERLSECFESYRSSRIHRRVVLPSALRQATRPAPAPAPLVPAVDTGELTIA